MKSDRLDVKQIERGTGLNVEKIGRDEMKDLASGSGQNWTSAGYQSGLVSVQPERSRSVVLRSA